MPVANTKIFKLSVEVDFLGKPIVFEATIRASSQRDAIHIAKDEYSSEYGTEPRYIKVLSIQKL